MSSATSPISPATFRFFRDLARNNRKDWMDANRERYRQHVVQPMRALLDALAPAALRLNPGFDTSGRTGANFSRINRDIRFSKDKTPYRPQMYLTFSSRANAERDDGQLYVGLAADGMTCGFRIYGSGKDSTLARVTRPRALDNAAWLAKSAKKLGRSYKSYWYSSDKGEWTRRDGWPAGEDWKKLQGWIVRRKLKPAAAGRIVKEAEKAFADLYPLYAFTSADKWK
jgi:uncharacterized protein (TIGR02453 family)